jgi:hypothetical protein
LQAISKETGILFGDDPWSTVADFYPVVWTTRAKILEPPFPKNFLVIVGLDFLNNDNGFPKLNKPSLSPGEFIVVPNDKSIELPEGGGGTSLFILFKM